MTFLRQSITIKIMLLVLGSTCIVLALVVDLMYTSSRMLIREEAEISARNMVTALANQVEQEFLLISNTADQLASALEIGAWSEEALLDQLKTTVSRNDKMYGSAVAFPPFMFNSTLERFAPYYYRSGDEIVFVQLGTESYNYFHKDWYRLPAREKKPVWTEPYFDAGGGNVSMATYARPILQDPTSLKGAELKYVVTADISLENLNRLVSSKKVYSTGFCFVISNNGTFVTHRNPDLMLKKTIFDIANLYPDSNAHKIARAMIGEQEGFYDVGNGLTGVDSYIAFSRMDPPGWTLATMIPKHELFAKVDDMRRDTLLLGGLGAVLLIIASLFVARSLSRPVRQMAGETLKIAEGNLDINLSNIRSHDEIGQLARAFTRMTEGLKERERIKDTFGRYLTQEVVKRLLESKDGLKLGGEIREISILMSDLRGFTALSSTMSPEQIIRFLNRYLGKMVEIILDHRGIIDEIIGDGILAFFGAPETLENHPELAVACAIKMQLAMEEINAQNEADGLPHLEMGVAVNTGEVVVGNIGSEKRAKYGAVGAQVNFTGRVESFTVGGQVLISSSTYEKLSDNLVISNVISVAMKGVPGQVQVYDVLGIKGAEEASLQKRNDSLLSLESPLTARIFSMDQKILESSGKEATITDVSLKSVRLVSHAEILQWDDLRIVLKSEPKDLEMYGKAISVQPIDGATAATIRLTSVSPDGYRLLRHILSSKSEPA
ncbi:PDC sensor domain-containing protein [Desulfomonile tiedjei]|uniref:Family 3 adenylate cyclase n=1 Tax=Desulfomonile tiedjei (strain ATCC 49306 / DSM 6799 / DCB-1) TaxID=706587 RepID=I4CBM0_DESTA|nr:adenylate/guanylate cyclase domain-containing protein [Desulfomonile tiedjei]AFM26961.1 family 3 adenylate cyclase [Desulfomonile tiedjei DSM 6799]